MRWVLPLVLAGCGADPCLEVPEAHNAVVTSPAPGSTHSAPWLPLLVRAPSEAEVAVCLDGEPYDDPTAIVRTRRTAWGGGWDYLAWLDLEDVSGGEHVVWARGPAFAAVSTFHVERTGHRVDVEVRDPSGELVPARVLVTDGDDVPVAIVTMPADADPSARDLVVSSLFAPEGTAVVWLPDGTFRLRAFRGVLWEVATQEVALDDDAVVSLVVEPAIDLAVVAADLHVHTGRSYDSFVPDRMRYESLVAAGLDVAVITDHNEVVDPTEALRHIPGDLRGVAGIEHDLRRPGGTEQPDWDLGHMNAFPVLGPDVAPLPSLEVAVVGEAVGAWRERQRDAPYPGVGEEVVLQLNHPRGIQFFPEDEPNREAWPLFGELGFDRDQAPGDGTNAWMTEADPVTGATALDYDALEIVNRFSWPLYLEVREDWFALMDAGWFLTGTGNSDSHALEVETAGLPVNLVQGAPFDLGTFTTSLREGRVLVTTGPIVELSVGGAVPGDVIAPGPVEATVRVRAASWVPVHEARLVVDGVVHRWSVPQPLTGQDLDVTFTMTVDPQRWLLAEAGWPLEGLPEGRLGPTYPLVAPGHRPIAFTNAVRLRSEAQPSESPDQ